MRWRTTSTLARLAVTVFIACAAAEALPDSAAAHDVAHAVSRYNPDGTPDQTFNVNGLVAVRTQDQAFANAVAIQSDGRIVVVGAVSNVSTGTVAIEVVRFNTDGSPDLSFGN